MAKKFVQTLTREDVPDFFRKLADAFETAPESEFPDCTKVKKLRVTIKDEYGQITAKLRLSSLIDECEECECECIRPDGLPKYKRLKKRMASSFKAIFRALHQNSLPPEEAVLDFIADSRLMTQYPGKGDPLYAEYNKLTDILEEAWHTKNLLKFHEIVDALNHIKAECHNKYK